MSKNEKKEQTEKFVGCILSVKTKPSQFGDVQHIIGTVREIDVDSAEQAIVLDQAMSNGAMLPDGFVLLSSQIADLQVMGKANEIQANLQSAYCQSEALKIRRQSSEEDSGARTNSRTHAGMSNGLDSSTAVNGNHVSHSPRGNSSSALVNSITSAMANLAVKNSLSDSYVDSTNHMIAKPKPRKIGGDSSPYSSPTPDVTPVRNVSSNMGNSSINSNLTSVKQRSSTNKVPSAYTNSTPTDGNNILLRTFGNLSANAGMSANGQGLFNAVANAGKSNVSASMSTPNDTQSPQKPMYDHKKLGVLSQFVTSDSSTTVQITMEESHSTFANNTPGGKAGKNSLEQRTPRNQGKGGRQGQVQQRHGETFESMSKDEMESEFDFEGSNAQFEKLPVTSKRPTKVVKNPQFSTTDTTYKADRVVESVTVRETVQSVKQFVTDTGVVIPSVDLPTRSKILNLAHQVGMTHSRVVEVMGRAVAQTVLPLLGDSYRLSPERVEDRPWVLVCAGPHWQGAIGIAAARILASMGVHTCVHAPKEEIQLCAPEELLYNLCGEMFSRNISDFKGLEFDLVIMAADDHLSRKMNMAPYARWLKKCQVVFVDPPLISSYRQQLDAVSGTKNKNRKIVIVSPVLPMAYQVDPAVKIFLVNLGIPRDIFEQNDVVYKSPFGDKFIIQLFSSGSK